MLDSRESHRKRAADLKRNHDALQKQPADPARDHLLDELKRERSALLALIGSINKQPTLNFFTDEGLLPNYAFPEEGVTLNSVIVRQLEKKEHSDSSNEQDTASYERVSLKFQRPAQAALNELVPNNVFYVSEHKINIEQVDLRLSKPSEWRMCPSCHYSEDVTLSGDKHSACPRCGDPYWADVQQKQNMLKLRQVYARANSRYDRISDDSDQREPKFFQRQLLIDIEAKNCSNAMRIDNPEVPFAFEFVRSATFREVNFGEQFGEQNTFPVAGKNSSRTGFQICKHCGMVRRKKTRKDPFTHALDCRLSRADAVESEEDWFESLYVFRELKSEAVRILLPLADVAETEKSRLSFYETIRNARDPNFRSVRIDQNYRGIVLSPEQGDIYILLWVDKHDDAYSWAMRHRCQIHPTTGSLQLFEVEHELEELAASVDATQAVPVPVAQPEQPVAPASQPLFELDEATLLSIGVPQERMALVKSVTSEQALEKIEARLPIEAFV